MERPSSPQREGDRRPGPNVPDTMSEFDALALVERLPAVTYIADAGIGGRWHYISPQLYAVLGFTPQEWLAEPEIWATLLHPDDRDAVFAREADALAGQSDASPWEYRLRHREGRTVWIRDDALLMADAQGRERWHGVMSDITEHKRTETELQRRAAQQAAVARLGERALAGADLAELMEAAATYAATILQVRYGAVVELTPDHESLVVRGGYGMSPEVVNNLHMPFSSRTQVGLTLAEGRPVIVNDWSSETRCERSPLINPPDTFSGLTVAIDGGGGPWGALGAQSHVERHAFTASDADFVQALANVLADAIQRRATEDGIRHQALHDPLTGLPNRVLFLDRLEHALARRGSTVAVLFLDLDHFKVVNDSKGHAAGDGLLVDVAPRLREAVRPGDTIGRFGGDEFGILLEEVAGERGAVEVAARIGAAFTRPFVVDGSEHFATASIGIALGRGTDVEGASLVRDADAAMYRAKERGRFRYELFDAAMRARALERFAIENDLRRALEREELRLAYQPMLSLRDGSVVAVEALLRWEHPTRGIVPPLEFVPLAEESGLIEPIGAWVLDEACRQAVRWHTSHPDARPISVAVNLSARQLVRRDIADVVASTLRRTGIEARCLSLEITESVLIEEPDTAAQTLRALGALGVHLALDDFGTGYSSLSYLTRLPLDSLKLDRAFVDGLGSEEHDTAIATAVVRMAQALSIDVTAEGVETERQLSELQRLGCAFAQGFLFARPVAAADITALLSAAQPWCGAPTRQSA